MLKYLLRALTFVLFLAAGWITPLQAQEFQFTFKGPDTLFADNSCEAVLTLDMDSLEVVSLVGAQVTDTILTIAGQYMLGDLLPAGTVVTFNWEATDDQGNDSIFVFTITVVDTLAPNFSAILPPDITVECDAVPDPPAITIFDNCDPDPVLKFLEVVAPGPCTGQYALTREWTATDLWGNVRVHTQVITVEDTQGPQLTGIPADTMVTCDAVPPPPMTGTSIIATDACDPNPQITFSETTVPGSCLDTYTLIRSWTATDDCGHATTVTQTIEVIDTTGPFILGVPADVTVDCDAVPPPPVTGPGGVTATDNCDPDPAIVYLETSNQDPDPASCAHYNYEITRSWTSADHCSNLQTAVQVVTVRDREAPVLYCVSQDTVVVGPSGCLASGSLASVLFVSDRCVPAGQAFLTDTADILNTSGSPLLTGVVDDILFPLPFSGLPAQYATGNVQLTVGLINADAEQPTEYYRVYGEDGTLLGQTSPTPSQCGSGITVLNTLNADQINEWAADGQILIYLQPEGNGVEAINQICVGGKVSIALTFDYEIDPPAGLNLQYRVDAGPLKDLPTGSENLSPGDYVITILATDCAGNADSCQYNLVVVDREAPLLVCPADLSISTDAGDCEATAAMVFPVDAWDNCGFPSDFTAGLPATPLVFFVDPNAGTVPQDVAATFSGVQPSGPGFGALQVILRADIADAGEFFEVFGENNTFLGITGPAAPIQECTQEAVFTFFISEAQLKTWTSDGQLDFRLVSNKDVINFSDFINPCGTLQPNGTDGVSYVRFELIYNAIQTTYRLTENPGGNEVASGTLVTPDSPPSHSLPIGQYTAEYRLEDRDGNATTCTWQISVADMVAPVVNCKPGLFVKTNPSGLVNRVLTPQEIWLSPATDNCGIAGLEVTPDTFTCNDAGSNVNVRLIAYDASGNRDTCFALVAIGNEELTPMFALDTCGGNLLLIPDTTFTHPSPGMGDFFLFNWSSANGFASNQSHPVIPNPKESDSGVYTLTVQGLTGCTSSGSVLIQIDEGGAFRPTLESNSPVCQGDSVLLTTDWQGASRYVWEHGPSSMQYETNVPQLKVPATPMAGGAWTLQVFPDSLCPSGISFPEEVVVNLLSVQVPDQWEACEGDSIILEAQAVNGSLFTWKTPTGITYLGQNPKVPVAAGVYRLTVESAQGCVATDSLTVSLLQRPVITALSHSCPDCVSGVEECELSPTIFPPNTGNDYLYTWINPGGFVFDQDSVARLTNVTGAQSGLYRLFVERTDNTCRSQTFSLFITLNDRPVAPVIGVNGGSGANPYAVCEGENVVLQVQNASYSGNVRYVWYGPLGTDTTAIPSLTIPAITINQGGGYRLEVTVNGCVANLSNEQILAVKPLPLPPVITATSPVCEGDSLILCGSFTAGALYEWTGPLGTYGPDACLVIPQATTNLSGDYEVRISVDGCFSGFAGPETIEVRSLPAAPLITDDCGGQICRDDGQDCSLTVISPDPSAQFSWYAAGVDTLLGATGSVPSFQIPLPGPYGEGNYGFYAVSEVAGCRSAAGVVHMIQINTVPEGMADAGPDVAICEGETLTLCAQAPLMGTGIWQQTAGPAVTILNPASACTGLEGYVPGSVMTFRWLLSNGACVNYSTDEAQASISRFEQAAVPVVDVRLCRAQATQISATPGMFGPGMWSQSPGQAAAGVGIAAPATAITGVNGLLPGENFQFLWTLPNGACPESSVAVTVWNFDDQADAGSDRSDCGYGCLSLPLVADVPELGSGQWMATGTGISLTPSGETSVSACGLQHGPNVFVWELNEGICGESSRDTIVVNYSQAPQAADDVVEVPFAGQVVIDVLANDQVYDAVLTSLTGLPGQGTLTPLGDGKYVYTPPIDLTGTTEFRYRVCSAICPDACTEARILIQINESASCAVPTIITPNQDGINDALVIPCLALHTAYPENSLSIFNQWGDEVFRASPYLNNWEGTYDGQLLPAGTYFFVFEPGGAAPASSGFILIKY